MTTKISYDLTGASGVPTQVGPFSHATRWGDLLFVTGQMPTMPGSGDVVSGCVEEQTEQVLANLDAVVTACGGRLDDALMVRVYLRDFDDYAVVNAVYRRWFGSVLPARTCVGVTGLAVGALIEIDLIVGIDEGTHR
ncbi:RidA family protein [Microbacterium sp. GXF0217]